MPPTPMAMISVSGEGLFGSNPAAFYPWIVARGWGSAYADHPWNASDAPSCDELIGKGLGFVLMWACGRLPEGQVIGHYHIGGWPVLCTPRGPGMFSRYDELFGPNGLESFEKESRARTDKCKSIGQESAIYLGGASVDAFTPQTAEKIVQRILDRWTDPIIRAGFDRVQLDAAAATRQLPGQPTPTMRWAEHLLLCGIAVDIETVELATPSAFPWFNGRFGIVDLPGTREVRSGPGWFNRSCQGVNTKRFLILQGSMPPIERLMALQKELADPNGAVPVVEWAGLGAIGSPQTPPVASEPTPEQTARPEPSPHTSEAGPHEPPQTHPCHS